MQITFPKILVVLGLVCGLGWIGHVEAGPGQGVSEPFEDDADICFENPCNEEEVCFEGTAFGREMENDRPQKVEVAQEHARFRGMAEGDLGNDYQVVGTESAFEGENPAGFIEVETSILVFQSATGPNFYCYERENPGTDDEIEECVCIGEPEL